MAHLPGTVPSFAAETRKLGEETDRRAAPRDRAQGGAGAVGKAKKSR
jgi:hypothetical protein